MALETNTFCLPDRWASEGRDRGMEDRHWHTAKHALARMSVEGETRGVEMVRWSADEYRAAFRDAGLHVAGQDNIPDREITIPPADEFPTEDWESRDAMVERYRVYGTLLTVGVVP